MITKYKTCKLNSFWSDELITRVDCTRETESSVFLFEPHWRRGERRELKATDFAQYHDSWEAAHQYLLDKAATALQVAEDRLLSAQTMLKRVEQLQKPEGA